MNRYAKAVNLAIAAHAGVYRKGTAVPYISHPLAVSVMAMEYGGDEDVAIAAVLHDVLEDASPSYLVHIKTAFGVRVAQLVLAVSNLNRGSWKEKRIAYLAHLANAKDDVLLISGCDKLHNARAIVSDGPDVFAKFNAGKDDVIWYYTELAKLFTDRSAPMAAVLSETVAKMKEL